MSEETDLLGQPLSERDRKLVALHREIEGLLGDEELEPCVRANLRHMLGASWQIVTDLGLLYEPGTLGDEP